MFRCKHESQEMTRFLRRACTQSPQAAKSFLENRIDLHSVGTQVYLFLTSNPMRWSSKLGYMTASVWSWDRLHLSSMQPRSFIRQVMLNFLDIKLSVTVCEAREVSIHRFQKIMKFWP